MSLKLTLRIFPFFACLSLSCTLSKSQVNDTIDYSIQNMQTKWLKRDTAFFVSILKMLDTTSNKNVFYHGLYNFAEVSNFYFFRNDSMGEEIFVFKDLIINDDLEITHKYNIIKGLDIYQRSSLFLKENVSPDSIRHIRDKYWSSTIRVSDEECSKILKELNNYSLKIRRKE